MLHNTCLMLRKSGAWHAFWRQPIAPYAGTTAYSCRLHYMQGNLPGSLHGVMARCGQTPVAFSGVAHVVGVNRVAAREPPDDENQGRTLQRATMAQPSPICTLTFRARILVPKIVPRKDAAEYLFDTQPRPLHQQEQGNQRLCVTPLPTVDGKAFLAVTSPDPAAAVTHRHRRNGRDSSTELQR